MIKIQKIFLWIGIILIAIGAIGILSGFLYRNIGAEEEIANKILRIGFLFLLSAGMIISAGALILRWE